MQALLTGLGSLLIVCLASTTLAVAADDEADADTEEVTVTSRWESASQNGASIARRAPHRGLRSHHTHQ